MAEATAIGTEAPYRVVAIENVTPTIVELWLDYLPGKYVLIAEPLPRSCARPTASHHGC